MKPEKKSWMQTVFAYAGGEKKRMAWSVVLPGAHTAGENGGLHNLAVSQRDWGWCPFTACTP